MDVTLEKTAPNHGYIKVKVEPADYQPEVEKKLKEYRREVNLKGFRPGKAPMGLLKKMYGRDLKASKVLDLAHEKLNEYLKENSELRIVGEVMPVMEGLDGLDWKKDIEYEFKYEIGLAPDFSYEPEKLQMTEHVIQVTDKEIEERIESLQMQFGENSQPETIEEEGSEYCIVMGKFSFDKKEGDTIVGGGEEGEPDSFFELSLPLRRMTEETAASFVGKSVGDALMIDLTAAFPEEEDRSEILSDIDEEVLAEKSDGLFEIDAITKIVPAELNQELIDKVLQQGEFDPEKMQEEDEEEFDDIEEAEVIDDEEEKTEEAAEVEGDTAAEEEADTTDEAEEKEYIEGEAAFREKLREQMSEAYQNEVKKIMGQRLEDQFAEQTEIDLPDEFLKRWLLSSGNKQESEDQLLTSEQVEEEYPFFRERLKWSLISNQIAKDQSFQVDYEDMIETAKDIVGKQFEQMGMDISQFGDQFARQFADDYLKRDDGKHVSEVMSTAIQRKVTEWLLEQIQVEQKEVTLEEFQEFMKEENERMNKRFDTEKEEENAETE